MKRISKNLIVIVINTLLFCSTLLHADITLSGYLHPGDNNDTQYIPKDPLTNNEEHTYDYYLNNPTKFYLSEAITISNVELVGATGIASNSNIRVYIDGSLVATGDDGANSIDINKTLSQGFHTISFSGSCYRNNRERDCSNNNINDIDDFYFSSIELTASSVTTAYHFIDRVHLGDNSDADDNYDIDNDSGAYYPDAPDDLLKEYNIGLNQSLSGFRIFISRMREIDEDGINKVEVYDINDSLIVSYYINHTDTSKFDFDKIFTQSVGSVGKIVVKSGLFTNDVTYDDISFGELVFIPYSSLDFLSPVIDYRMDECSWDGDSNTYEIKNYGTLGDDYNATALNDANVTDGKIYTGGDISATDISDKAILLQNNIELPLNYTLTTWVKFPLNENGHVSFNNKNFFNIADRPGSSNDNIYFALDTTNNSWDLCMQGDDYECQDYNPQNLSGWHLLSFVVDGNDGATEFYVDTAKVLEFDQAPSGELGLIFNSDYQSNNDNEPNGQSIGAVVDEFKIFNRLFTQSEIQTLYNNESSGKNWDGSTREMPQCGEDIQDNKTTFFNAVSSINSSTCNAVDDWGNNLITQIVNQPYGLYILSQDESNQSSEANITKVTLRYYDDGNTTDCRGNLLADVVKCDDTTSTTCNDTNTNGCAYYDITTNRAVKCVQVYVEGRDKNNSSLDINSSYSSDNYAIRPSKFSVELPVATTLYAGEDFNITFKALDANSTNTADYNESKNISFEVNATEVEQGCKTGDLNLTNFSFEDGVKTVTTNYSETGEINITIKEISDSEFAKVDIDDTNDSQRLIELNTTTIIVKPYDINITKVDFNTTTNQNWLYMASDISDMNITLHIEVGAFNKQGVKLEDFNSTCYAKDINVTFYYDTDTSRDLNLTLDGNLTSLDVNITDINKTLQIPKGLFVSGEANASYVFGIDRDRAVVQNPLQVILTDVNITTSNVAKNENNMTVADKNVTFYYSRVKTSDISTNQKDIDHSLHVEVYSSSVLGNFYQNSLNWYIMELDNSSGAVDINDSSQFNTIVDTSISLNNFNFINGKENFSINNPSEVERAYMHVEIPQYLWYSVYKDHNNSGDCSEHPCFVYTFVPTNNQNYIKSGDFNGTTIGDNFDTNITKRGIKVFR